MLKPIAALTGSLLAFSASGDDTLIRQAALPYLESPQNVQITDTPLPGVKAVQAGLQVIYVADDGRYVLGGPLLDTRANANLTEQALNRARAGLIETRLDATRVIDFPAPDSKHEVVVFTDIDCGYCRRLHDNLDQYHEAGISLRYVMLPRAGVGSESYRKTVDAVCADNPQQSITQAMAGEIPPPQACDHPIDEHMALARELRINMTPMMLLADGSLLRGVQQPDGLLQLLSDEPFDSAL